MDKIHSTYCRASLPSYLLNIFIWRNDFDSKQVALFSRNKTSCLLTKSQIKEKCAFKRVGLCVFYNNCFYFGIHLAFLNHRVWSRLLCLLFQFFLTLCASTFLVLILILVVWSLRHWFSFQCFQFVNEQHCTLSSMNSSMSHTFEAFNHLSLSEAPDSLKS